jgi:hypothetical protein
MTAPTFATSMLAFSADVAQRIAAKLEVTAAKWRDLEGEIRGEALAQEPHADDGCLDCLSKERSEAHAAAHCNECDRDYSPDASECPNCAAEAWGSAP